MTPIRLWACVLLPNLLIISYVHVNHLNRAVKETTQKTTTQHISEHLLQEAKILLKHTAWNVSEIAFALGFTEATHFNNFFKKHTRMSPLQFRNV